jgi:hypothetical protein
MDAGLMARRHRPTTLIPMAAGEWRVIVVRAWREGSQMRIRVLVDGDGPRSWVARAPYEAVGIVRGVLEELEAGDETPPATTG